MLCSEIDWAETLAIVAFLMQPVVEGSASEEMDSSRQFVLKLLWSLISLCPSVCWLSVLGAVNLCWFRGYLFLSAVPLAAYITT